MQLVELTFEAQFKENPVKRIYVMTFLAVLLTFCSSAYAAPKKNIVETAVAAGDFKTCGGSEGGAAGGHPQWTGSLHRLRPNGCGVCQAARRNGSGPAQA